jgi:cytochrome P450
VVTNDLRAIKHVLAHTEDFHKWALPMRALQRTLGNGILLVEDADHRRQRRVLNPAFGPAQIRGMSGIFIDKSNEVMEGICIGAFALILM